MTAFVPLIDLTRGGTLECQHAGAIASRSRGQAIAIKIGDGSKPALFAASVAALDQLGWLDAQQREELRPWRAEVIASWRGTPVGERKPVFRLQPA